MFQQRRPRAESCFPVFAVIFERTSGNMAGRSGLFSLPSHLDVDRRNWSPRAHRHEPVFDSDDDKVEEMSSPESFEAARDISSPAHFALYDGFTSLSFETRAEPAKKACEASSRCLTIGRPMRSVGLKDVDLSSSPRAEHIRQAKLYNKSPKHRASSMPVRLFSFPAMSSMETPCRNRQVSKSEGRPFSLSSPKAAVNIHSAAVPVNPAFPKMKTAIPRSATYQSRGQRASSHHGSGVPFIDLTGDQGQQKSEDVVRARDSSQESEDDVFITSEKTYQQDISSRRRHSSGARHRWMSAIKQLPKHKQANEKVGVSSFSENEDDCDHTEVNSRTQLKTKAPYTQPRSVFGSIIQLFVILFTVLVGLSLYLHHNPHGLCLEGEFRSNLTNLEHTLGEELYGQHLAKKIILAALRSHVNQPRKKALVLSFHGGTGVGKNFVSNLIAKHLFKWGYKSSFVHKIIVPLHFPHKSEVELYSKQLTSWITGNVSHCSKRSLFIFDEMDKIDVRLMETLRPFLNHRGEKSGVDFKGAIFLFLSNSGGKAINQFAWENYHQGKTREDISLVELEQILHRDAEQNEELWYRDILKSELVDHLVPFLPLERTHVKQCIRRDLREKGLSVAENVVTEIADQMLYFPADFEVFSASGCKKVSSRVDVGVN